jgi:hypothetical membrane protein
MRLYASIYLFAYTLFLFVAIALPYFGEDGIHFFEHNLSDLGAQQTAGNWAMNMAFMIMSLATMVYGSYALRQHWLQLLVLYFFTCAFGLTAVYQSAGVDTSLLYDYTHDSLHHLFSTIAGFGFMALCISFFFKLKLTKHRVQTAMVFLVAILLSVLEVQFSQYEGLFQRLLFLTCFGWLFYALTVYDFDKKKRHHKKRMKRYKNI